MAAPRLKSRAFRARPPAALTQGAGGTSHGPVGPARLGRRTKDLVKRLGPGDIAVIDHSGIDRVAGEDIVASGCRCVINLAPSVSPRYANQGPAILVESGVHLVDAPGAPLFDVLKDGDELRLDGGTILRGGEAVWEGQVQDREHIERAYEEGRQRIGEALEAFAENTMRHIREERELLSGQIDLPDFDTVLRDRPTLVVVRGVDHKRDLRILRAYVRDTRPALIAVDGGADAIVEAGWRPDMIVGDMDSAGDEALRAAGELVVHAYPDGRAPGRERLDALGLPYKVVPAPATSEDVALLIAAEKGAKLIVTVGSHFNLVEFLDKNRSGMSSTFLTRLRVGEILVDAKGVSRLYRPSAGRGPIAALVLAAFATFVVVVATSPRLGQLLDLLWLKIEVLLGLK
ncbi:MAG TPA: putative cytokinetic ring protein SteA [Thermoleophilaceae bacterium]|jgi:uncharacterized membrane-anchored protein